MKIPRLVCIASEGDLAVVVIPSSTTATTTPPEVVLVATLPRSHRGLAAAGTGHS